MATLVVLQSVVLGVLVVLVIGLLRAHADVLRRLHELGAGLYDDPTADSAARSIAADLEARVVPGVPAPGAALAARPADIMGVAPHGSALHIGVSGADRLTLLAFLSSGCVTCDGFWDAFRDGGPSFANGAIPRVVVVTKGSEEEHAPAVVSKASRVAPTIMSSQAWRDYGVPGSPYFVLVHGEHGVLGEGSAVSFAQLSGLLERALVDRGFDVHSFRPRPTLASRDGLSTEERVDRDLRRAGLFPGHPDLYPSPERAGGA